jgi:hypothetical protein
MKIIEDIELPIYSSFLERYKSVSASIESETLNNYKNLIAQWKEKFSTALKEYNQKETPDYNIFNILKIPNIVQNEEQTHTPIIGNLLNVRGSHGQNELFYRLFIEQCISNSILRNQFIPDDYSRLFIEQEKVTIYGRLDILISYRSMDKNFGICIENKIYAPDQINQLERYYKYLSNNFTCFFLFYLTPNRGDPKSTSINLKLFDLLKSQDKIKTISYSDEISDIINNSLSFISSDRLRGTLKQYLTIINALNK